MSKIRWRVALAIGAGAIAIASAYQLGRVRADGAPTTTPLYYSGYATDSGTPIDGVRDVRVELWRDPTSTDTSMRACETIVNGAPFVDGYFRVTLEPSCVQATRTAPNLFVELLIGGTRIGERAAIGAVPYALEADHALHASDANTAAGALDTRIAALEAPSSFLARATSVQTIANATGPVVMFSEIFDTHGEFDPTTSTFTPTAAGLYDVGCNVIFNGPGTSTSYLEAGIFVNGTRMDVAAGRGDAYVQAYRARSLLQLAAGDAVTCRAYQNSGSSMPLIGPRPGEAVSSFSALRVGN